ncbi:DUF3857 domain-containing transglutaminase family protein [Chromobacterium violaceum]|uniref:DUF3857 domain-containing transglutaminase family protein n=1 Tax=Chromobacterium violaceum TaxID=536 RepID=UPI001B34081D|nr:DUF3857 domain-containing protein [Chromobacterium violaceum]MBP4045060.1 DUF3857 domain-containing protein [Chromobacterium violaceum]
MSLRFSRLALAAALTCAGQAAHAVLQPAADAPLARRSSTVCHHLADNGLDCTTENQFTILKPAGKDLLSRIDFTYADTDSLEVLDGEVRQPNGRVVKLDKSQVETRAAPNPYAGVSRDKQTWIAFPELAVGSVVSYRVKRRMASPPLSRELLYRLDFDAEPTRSDSFRFELDSPRPLLWRGDKMDDFKIDASADGKRIVVEQKAPRYLNFTNEWDNSALRGWPRLSIATSGSPQSHFGVYAERYNQILSAPLPPAAAVEVEAQRGKPAAEQVAAFMQHINGHYRYLNDQRLAERGLVPFTLAEIEQHGYGDCKDLATLLAAMLRASGIAAEPTLVFRGNDAPRPLLPGLGTVNHMIVRAVVDGKTEWLDPTNPFFVPGRIMPDLQDRASYRIGADGQVREEAIPMQAATLTSRSERVETLRRDGSAAIAIRGEVSGWPLVQLAMQDRYQGAASSDQSLCRAVNKQPKACKVERPATGFLQPARYAARIDSVDLRAVERISGLYLYDPGLEHDWNGFDSYLANGNQADVYLGDAETVERAVTLRGARAIQPPFSCQARSRWFDLSLEQRKSPDGIRYQYRQTRKVRWLSREEIASPEFIRFNAEARACAIQARQIVKL